jgi:hypothetical protein
MLFKYPASFPAFATKLISVLFCLLLLFVCFFETGPASASRVVKITGKLHYAQLQIS